jgi:Carboxypeptidase regulatory-like domain
MKTHTLLFIAIALLGFCLRSPCYAQSTTVRGQLLHTDQSPAAGIQVLLMDESFNLSSPKTTNADGMYYFDNVPLGSYWLTVPFPRNDKRSPQTFRVQITHSPYEDLPRLTVAARIGAQSKSSGGVQQLKDAHLGFINHYTCAEGTRATWDQASFDKEVADITQQFTDAEVAVSKTVPGRKEFIRNSANLFRRDAALVQKQHCVSPSFAAIKKKELQQNYDLLLQLL